MARPVEGVTEFVDRNLALVLAVDLAPRKRYPAVTLLTHVSHYHMHKLLEIDSSITVPVKRREYSLQVTLLNLDSVVTYCL